MAKVVIGVDGGTTAVKAVAFDVDGKIQALHSESVPVEYGKNGEAEQDMNAIWQAVATCLRSVTSQLAEGTEIVAVGLTGQGDGCWLIDKNGEPVRKAANWMDGRAADVVEQWSQDGKAEKVLATTGTTVFSALAPVLLAKFAKAEPETIEKAAHLVYCKDWLRYKLTGEISTDYTEASRNFFDVNDCKEFSAQLASDLGLPEAMRLVPKVIPFDGDGGKVTKEAEAETGVPAGTQVGVGMIDVAITGPGLGALNDGDAWLILGTTGFVGTFLEKVSDRRSQNSMVLATGRGTQVLEFLAPMTGTPNLDWIKATLGFADKSWSEVEPIARESVPGSNGVIYLPYASPGGERAPFLDTNASASWLGMSITTTPADILHSVYEGVTFTLAECVKILQIEGDLVVSGGGFRSNLVCELLADITGHRVLRQDAPEAGARGAAVCALVSAGEAKDVKEASQMLGTEMEVFETHPARHQVYQKVFETFIETRDTVRPQWKKLRALRKLNEND